MFSVEYRYVGQGLWARGSMPMTEIVATAHARALQDVGFADEARVVPSSQQYHDPRTRVDLRV